MAVIAILNTDGRTDTLQYHAKWLSKRFEEGHVLSRDPLFPNDPAAQEEVVITQNGQMVARPVEWRKRCPFCPIVWSA